MRKRSTGPPESRTAPHRVRSFRLTGPPETDPPSTAGSSPNGRSGRSSDADPLHARPGPRRGHAARPRPFRLRWRRGPGRQHVQRRSRAAGDQLRRVQHAARGLRKDHLGVQGRLEGPARRPGSDLPGVLRRIDAPGVPGRGRLRGRRRGALAGPRRRRDRERRSDHPRLDEGARRRHGLDVRRGVRRPPRRSVRDRGLERPREARRRAAAPVGTSCRPGGRRSVATAASGRGTRPGQRHSCRTSSAT